MWRNVHKRGCTERPLTHESCWDLYECDLCENCSRRMNIFYDHIECKHRNKNELSEEYVLMWNVQQWLDKQKKSLNPHERNTVATNINVTCVKISQQAWSSFMATLKGNIAIT